MTSLEQMRAVCQERITDPHGRQRLKGCWWNVRFSRHLSIYLTALVLSAFHFIVGFVKAKRLGPDTKGIPSF